MAVLVAFDPCRGSGQRGSVMHVNDSGQRVNTTSKARPVWHLSMVRVTHMCALEKLEPCPDSLPAAMYALARRRTPHLVILLQALLSSSSPPPSPAAATAAAAACSISISISCWCLGWGRLSWLIALCHACIMLSVASHRLMHAMAGAYAAIRSCRHVRHVL